MTAEEKVLEKIRKVLIADSATQVLVGTRVYASHISSIDKPVYPAISLFLINSSSDFAGRTFVKMNVQIDCWFPSDNYNMSQVLSLVERIRALLDRQNLSDTAIGGGLKVGQSYESLNGPVLFEEDNRLIHYPMIYTMVAA